MRRLLTTREVADKLGRMIRDGNEGNPNWFYDNRKELEAAGFPGPVGNRVKCLGDRWDEAAIDAWLDTLMPAHLRAAAGGDPEPGVDVDSFADVLDDRARQIAAEH